MFHYIYCYLYFINCKHRAIILLLGNILWCKQPHKLRRRYRVFHLEYNFLKINLRERLDFSRMNRRYWSCSNMSAITVSFLANCEGELSEAHKHLFPMCSLTLRFLSLITNTPKFCSHITLVLRFIYYYKCW